MESQGGPPRRTLRPRRPTWPSRSDQSRTPGKPTCQIRENCSPRPGAPPLPRASRPCLRCAPLPRFRFASRHHLMRPTKTFEVYGFSDSELHLLCLPETTSRGRGCPGTLLERTHDGYARAPPACATKPFWLLVDPAQGPMDLRWMVLAALVAGVGEGAFLSSWNAIIADQTTVEQRNAAFALSFVLNNVFSGVGLALPFSFPFIQAQAGLGSQTIHVAALVLTDGLGFV